jgi:hypothetical protein
MKKICFLFFILAAVFATAQNKDYLISWNGLGALKLGMSQAEVEKVLNKKILLPNSLDTINNYYDDTAKLTYKNIAVQLEFNRNYHIPNEFYMQLIGIRSSSPLCKTATGIGVGTDNLKIIADYSKYHINIQPGFYSYYETEKGKGKSTVRILDDAASTMDGSDAYTIVFYLLNKKVVSFELKGKFND